MIKICKNCSTIHIRWISQSDENQLSNISWYALKENRYKFTINEDINQALNYRTMLEDEKIFPNTRKFNDQAKFQTHLINVYKYFFNDWYKGIQQRHQTLHLAMAFFTQVIMRNNGIRFQDLELLIPTALILASKVDEIDYNLPSFEYILQHMKKSEHMKHYSLKSTK